MLKTLDLFNRVLSFMGSCIQKQPVIDVLKSHSSVKHLLWYITFWNLSLNFLISLKIIYFRSSFMPPFLPSFMKISSFSLFNEFMSRINKRSNLKRMLYYETSLLKAICFRQQRCSIKRLFLKSSQYSQENSCFPVNFAKFLRTPILK